MIISSFLFKNLYNSLLYIRKYIYIIFIFLLNFNGTQTSKINDSFNIDEATNILSQMSDLYKGFENFKVEFIYTRKDPESGNTEELIGKLITEKDNKEGLNKYILEMDDTYTVTDGETKWVYVKSINEVTISDYDSDDDDEKLLSKIKNTLMYPTEWLKPVLYEKKEDIDIIEMIPFEEENQVNEKNIEETETSEESEIDRVTLEINHENKELLSWRIDTEDGIQYSYLITKLTSNIKITENFFRFDPSKYKNIIINDLR